MKPLKLYRIEPVGLPVVHIAARSNEQAAEMYVTWQAAHKLAGCAFSVELVALDGFERDERLQLKALLASSTEGIARRDQGADWVIDSDGWASFDAGEMERPGVRIFQMRDPTPIEAFVLASDCDRATELFEEHLKAHGGDSDTLLFRQWSLNDLNQPERSHVREALALHREGLLTWDAKGRWTFATPLGAWREAE